MISDVTGNEAKKNQTATELSVLRCYEWRTSKLLGHSTWVSEGCHLWWCEWQQCDVGDGEIGRWPWKRSGFQGGVFGGQMPNASSFFHAMNRTKPIEKDLLVSCCVMLCMGQQSFLRFLAARSFTRCHSCLGTCAGRSMESTASSSESRRWCQTFQQSEVVVNMVNMLKIC